MERDPIEAILAVECPRVLLHLGGEVGDACWYSDGEDGDPMFCEARIRAALSPEAPKPLTHEERSKDWRCDLRCAGGPCAGCEPLPKPAVSRP